MPLRSDARSSPRKPFANARLDSPVRSRTPRPTHPTPRPEDAAAVPFPQRVTPYVPWKYMYPHQWTLACSATCSASGRRSRCRPGVNDPAGFHVFAFNFLFPTTGSPSGQVSYSYYRASGRSLGLSLSKTDLITNGLIVDNQNLNYLQRTLSFSASMGLPVLRTADASGDLTFAYDYSAYGPISPIPVGEPTGAITIKPEIGPYADLEVLLVVLRRPLAGSTRSAASRGAASRSTCGSPTRRWGAGFSSTEVDWSWTEYFTPPWARLHALALITQGGFGSATSGSSGRSAAMPTRTSCAASCSMQRQFAFLRGYPVNVVAGDSFLVASGEYRAPLVWIERGYQTFPVYLRRIWGTAFVDAGNAYQGPFHPTDLRTDAGVEAHLEFMLFYYIDSQIQLGYARGFQSGGGNQLYFVTAVSF